MRRRQAKKIIRREAARYLLVACGAEQSGDVDPRECGVLTLQMCVGLLKSDVITHRGLRSKKYDDMPRMIAARLHGVPTRLLFPDVKRRRVVREVRKSSMPTPTRARYRRRFLRPAAGEVGVLTLANGERAAVRRYVARAEPVIDGALDFEPLRGLKPEELKHDARRRLQRRHGRRMNLAVRRPPLPRGFDFRIPVSAAGPLADRPSDIEMVTVEAWSTSVPGLLLTRAGVASRIFRLTHVSSGLCATPGVCSSNPHALLRLAKKFGEAGDWTASAEDLRLGVTTRATTLLAEFCCEADALHCPGGWVA